MFYRGHRQATKNLFSSFLTWIRLSGIQLQKSWEEFAYIRQKKRDGVIAMKIEKPQIHFLSDVLPVVDVLLS